MRILAVDDNPAQAALFREMLADGFTVDWAGTLDKSRFLFIAYPYACVLLDYLMPGDSVGFLEFAKHRAPVIVVTGHGDEEVASKLMKLGAADYLNKNSLTAEKLKAKINEATMRRAG